MEQRIPTAMRRTGVEVAAAWSERHVWADCRRSGSCHRPEFPMPVPLMAGDYMALQAHTTATLATAERREAITARERAAWQPDDEYRAAVARWLADDTDLLAAD